MFSYFLVPKHVRKAIDVYGAKHRPRSIYGARMRESHFKRRQQIHHAATRGPFVDV